MDRLKGFGTFLGYAAGLLIALRIVYVAIPLFYPEVPRGPFRVERLADAPQYLGFSPWVPYYRPEKLGRHPMTVTIDMDPHPKVSIAWEGKRFLRLTERRGDAGARLPRRWRETRPEAAGPAEGSMRRLSVRRQGLRIDVETNLSAEDLERVLRTLRPFEELQ